MVKQYTYEIEQQMRGHWAVIACGPKGGRRWIATYKNRETALSTAYTLNENEEDKW